MNTMTFAKTAVTPEVLSAIDARHELMRRAYEMGDAALLADEFFTSDAWVIGEQDMTWRNRAGMVSLYTGIVGKYVWTTRRECLVPIGPDAVMEFLIGMITPHDPAEETLVYKIQFVWTRSDGAWKCATQFFALGTDFNVK